MLKKVRNIILYIAFIFFVYIIFYFSCHPYDSLPFLDISVSMKLQIYYAPFFICILSLVMFAIEKIITIKYNWIYFFIISISLFAHLIAFYLYKN